MKLKVTALNPSSSPNLRSAQIPYLLSAAVVITIILLFAAVILWQESKQAVRNAEVTTVNASTLLSKHISGIFDKADTLLQAVEYQYRDDNALGVLETRRFNDYLKRALMWSQDFDNIGFVDAKGIYRYGLESETPVDLSSRDYYTFLRDRPVGSGSGPMFFSQLIFTAISKKWTLVMSRRIEQPDGSFGGVIFIRWDVERLSALLASVDLGKSGTLVLRSSEMTQISSYPESDDPASGPGNRKISQTLLDLVKESPESGFYTAVSPLDMTERYYAYTKVDDYPFYVIAGEANNRKIQTWKNSERILLIFSALMIVVVVFGAQHMSRLTKNRIRLELNNFAQRVLNASPVAMFLLNKEGVVMKANPAAEKLFDYGDDELVGVSAKKLQVEGDTPVPTQRLADAEKMTGLVKEAPYQRKDGSNFTALRALSSLPEASGETNYYLETVVDITDLKRIQEQLRIHAETDKLTGLLNRRSGDIIIEQAIHDADINNAACAVIMGDIDHFKRVNDTFGHLVGDRILVSVAKQIKSTVRAGDYCIRWGGEEFLIVLPRCSQSFAATLADRIRSEIANLRDEQVGPITMSFGVGEWARPETPESLIHKTDFALYRAKASGRNRVEIVQVE